MSSESHNTIARRIIAEYKQDSEAFKKKYVDRPDLIKLMSDPSKHAEFIALASAMDMAKDNPIQAFENYPEIFSFMKGSINRMDAFEFSNVVQKMPEKFHEWRTEIGVLFGKTKIRKIKELLVYLDTVLGDGFYNMLNPIVQKTLDGIREELIEQQQYWVSELKKLEDNDISTCVPDAEPTVEDALMVRVKRIFSFMLKRDVRQISHILTQSDYDKLIEWVYDYFNNNLSIPEITKPVEFVRTSKGNVIAAFKTLFKQLHPTMNYPDSLFELIRKCFFQYREDTIDNMRKTKAPSDFHELLQ